MKKSEVAKLLTFVGSVEGREAATDLQVEAWATLIDVVKFVDAMQAAKEHYLNESRRLWPADILNWRDAHVKAEVEDVARTGLVLSQRLWVNAMVLPAEEIVRLGAEEAAGRGEQYAHRLQVLFGLTERPKAVGA